MLTGDKLETVYTEWTDKQAEKQTQQKQNTQKQRNKTNREKWTRPTKEEWNLEKKKETENDMGQEKMIMIAKGQMDLAL